MIVEREVPLAPLTTLQLGGRARRMALVGNETEVVEAVREAESKGEELFVLGRGSNVVVADEGFDGVVLRMASRGVVVSEDRERVRIEVAAGEDWDALVERSVAEGWCGIECLSGIPGLVGATPIQNVGAYGQEVKDSITRVRVYDRVSHAFADLDRAECRFGYRSSLFRHDPRFIVVSVSFELAKDDRSLPIRYAELTAALGVKESDRAPLAAVRATVLRLRRAKGMVLDAADGDSVSVGSFFINPTLDSSALGVIEHRVDLARVLRPGETMPRFPFAEGRWKLSAGWLIERAGFKKGYGSGRVGVSGKHALALVNRGQGTTRELLELAREIRDGVRAKFGVELSPEPVMVGCVL
jgi:UDP-N-acetylmuramate dehydrogenase